MVRDNHQLRANIAVPDVNSLSVSSQCTSQCSARHYLQDSIFIFMLQHHILLRIFKILHNNGASHHTLLRNGPFNAAPCVSKGFSCSR